MTISGTSGWTGPRGKRGVIDGGTVVVVLVWVGILFLIPSRPSRESTPASGTACMISAWPKPLEALPLDLHPDLVTLPSPVSFGAGGPAIDSLQGVPTRRQYAGLPLLSRAEPAPSQEVLDDGDSLRKAAAAAVEDRRLFPLLTDEKALPIMTSSTRWNVLCSGSLGNTKLNSEFAALVAIPDTVKAFEAELWVQFDEDGVPQEIFIEQTDNRDIAQRAVRRLWNPAHWISASGQGRLRIRYQAESGGQHANQGD